MSAEPRPQPLDPGLSRHSRDSWMLLDRTFTCTLMMEQPLSTALCVQAVKRKKEVHLVERSLHSCFGLPPPRCSTAVMQTSEVRSVSITCSCIIPTLCNSLLKKRKPFWCFPVVVRAPLHRANTETWKRKNNGRYRCRMKAAAPPARHPTPAANEQITAFNPPD